MLKIEGLTYKLQDLEHKIDYTFRNNKHLFLALTHSSYANERKEDKIKSNERLEFLGDSVLNIAISEHIYNSFNKLNEGELTRVRATVVCETSLAECANIIELGKYLVLGKGEENTGGRFRTSILSDAFEALIGAIYLDGGMKNAKKFIFKALLEKVNNSVNGLIFMDYKTQIQEIIQKTNDKKIMYEIIDEKGPDHNKVFVSQIKVGEAVLGAGEGRSKKEAEQNAAKQAVERLMQNN